MSTLSSIPVIAIVGPTAIGKTALAIALGQRFGGEAISADSRQIYRYMDIGTAKATAEEQAALRHHLIDVVDPDEILTLAQYQRRAYQAIAETNSRGRLAILVGGSGLYVRATLEGWTIPEIAPNLELRQQLEAIAAKEGPEELHRRLLAVDPVSAQRIDLRNVRRVVRALEVHAATGQPISVLQQKHPPNYRLLTIGLTMDRPLLYERIDSRIERMIAHGLADEVRWLMQRGYDSQLPSMTGLGYRQMVQYLTGKIPLQEAVRLIKHDTRRFVRQQYNWFRLSNKRIHWVDTTNRVLVHPNVGRLLDTRIDDLVSRFLQNDQERDTR